MAVSPDERMGRLEERMDSLADILRQHCETTRASFKEQGAIIKELDRKLDDVERWLSGWRYAGLVVAGLVSGAWAVALAMLNWIKT